ncbi:MAG: PadR family transcriptional regulator [Actinomycetota bacterium]
MSSHKTADAATAEGGLPRNFLRPCLLLLLREGVGYGYDLHERLREFGVRRSDPGFLYRTLRSLEHEGLITSWWELSEVGPPRRTYELSAEGEDWLHGCADTLRHGQQLLTRFADRYAGLAQPNTSGPRP